MNSMSSLGLIEASRLASDGAWLVLLEIQFAIDGIEPIRLVRNTENITWGGYEWQAFPFELDPAEQNSDGEIPALRVRVSNVTRGIQYYLEQGNGGVDSSVVVRVVHSANLGTGVFELEEEFVVQQTSYDTTWATFTLGGSNNLKRRIPQRRILKDFCPFQYKGPECKSTSGYTACGKTLAECRARGNSHRFGGEPSIPISGLYVS